MDPLSAMGMRSTGSSGTSNSKSSSTKTPPPPAKLGKKAAEALINDDATMFPATVDTIPSAEENKCVLGPCYSLKVRIYFEDVNLEIKFEYRCHCETFKKSLPLENPIQKRRW